MSVKNVKNVPVTFGPLSLAHPVDWWLHFQRANQPLATDYDKFLKKDTFQSGGQIWQCTASVIHQGPDPLNGEHQPCEHFYVLEHENANSTILKYDSATGLSQLSLTTQSR